ncbi:MAG: ABC transporter ATP-binding protein [Candidatus Competibacteraceae bacterium]|nr:ABC transporter ATP-binding protein [Candidatus Competibacteraceae bacterium]
MIQFSALGKRFGSRSMPAVDGVSGELRRPATLALLGPSGGGKTTLLRLIAGLERPDAGHIRHGAELLSTPRGCVPPHRRPLGMIFQDLALWPHLNVYDHLAFGLQGVGLSRQIVRERVFEALEWVALTERAGRLPQQLSGGERQRVALARALITRPPYLLLDEPFSSLDPFLKARLIELLRSLQQRFGLGMLYVTHQLDEALQLADGIVVMARGRWLGALARSQFAAFTPQELLAWYAETLCAGDAPS